MNVQWLKSSFSEQPDGNCIEVASRGEDVLIRESDAPDLVIRSTPDVLRALMTYTRRGQPGRQAYSRRGN